MDVTIIGTGNMARGIATRLLAGGNGVTLLGTERGRAEELAKELEDTAGGAGVEFGEVGDGISGEVIVLAVPYEAVPSVAERYASELAGKVVVDITNPVNWETFDGLVIPPDSSAAEEISGLFPGAAVVKAFNTTFAGTLVEGGVGGEPLDVFVAADDEEAKQKVLDLVATGGLRGVDAGPLRRARQLEELGFFGMTLQQPLDLGFRSAWKLAS
jgi:8-hydroxy-5-deazaflavin:NADPH oxidoreductase